MQKIKLNKKIKSNHIRGLSFNSSKTKFLLIRLKQQLAKLHIYSLHTTHSTCNRGFISDKLFTFSDQMSALSKSYYYHIRKLRCIHQYVDFKTASTITTSTVQSTLNYCNSFYHKLSNDLKLSSRAVDKMNIQTNKKCGCRVRPTRYAPGCL